MYFSAGDQKEADETTGLVFFDLAQVNNLDNRYYILHYSNEATLKHSSISKTFQINVTSWLINN